MVVPHKKEGRNFKGRPLQKKKKLKEKNTTKKNYLQLTHTHTTQKKP
jgi:hypothetical protein